MARVAIASTGSKWALRTQLAQADGISLNGYCIRACRDFARFERWDMHEKEVEEEREEAESRAVLERREREQRERAGFSVQDRSPEQRPELTPPSGSEAPSVPMPEEQYEALAKDQQRRGLPYGSPPNAITESELVALLNRAGVPVRPSRRGTWFKDFWASR